MNSYEPRLTMKTPRARISAASLALLFGGLVLVVSGAPQANAQAAAPVTRSVGAIKAITGTHITMSPDSGSDLQIQVDDSTRLVRTNPGETDLKKAAAIKLSDLQTGDRMLVRGKLAGDGKTLTPSIIVVLKKSDLSDLQQRQLQDWQKRGVGGLVRAVDADAGTVTISVAAATGNKNVLVRSAKNSTVRRYAPDSVKFDDARRSSLADIKPGDQLRARGASSTDGAELTAEEIVSGSFRNIAGTIQSANLGAHTITILDLFTRKPVTVRFSSDSQLRKLPPMIAQRIAMRLKGGAPASGAPAAGAPPAGMSSPSAPRDTSTSPGALGDSERMRGGNRGSGGDFDRTRGPGGGRPGGGAADMQQMLSRMPPLDPAELQKGDAVMLVATGGVQPTAITLLTGVEAILTASPDGSSAASLLSPWNLASSAADAAISQ